MFVSLIASEQELRGEVNQQNNSIIISRTTKSSASFNWKRKSKIKNLILRRKKRCNGAEEVLGSELCLKCCTPVDAVSLLVQCTHHTI